MSEQKREFSKLCLAGFILSIMPLAVLALCTFIDRCLPFTYRVNTTEDYVPGAFIIFPLAGFIISIAGVVSARRNDKRGKAFGIAGIVLPVIPVNIIGLMIGTIIFQSASTVAKQQGNEMYGMGDVTAHENKDYDVSQIRLPEGYDLNSLNITVSEAEFKEYAESKLYTVTSESDKSIRGTYQDYNFLIIKSDRLDDWLALNSPRGFEFTSGYASIYYEDSWEFAAIRPVYLDVYKDPSDKFIVITNCGDYKVISEFFGLTDNYNDPALNTEETMSIEFYENNEQVVYLRNNINEDMSLPEIIDVYEKMCEEYPYNDVLRCHAGTLYYGPYDHSAGQYTFDGEYFCIGLHRWVSLEEGAFTIDMYILYEPNTTNNNIEHVSVSDYQVDGDFFDYVRATDAYEYACSADIVRIDIYMAPL